MIRRNTMQGSECQLQTQCKSRGWLRTEAPRGKASLEGKASKLHNNKFSTQSLSLYRTCAPLEHITHTVHPLLMERHVGGTQPLPIPEKPQQAWQSPGRIGPSPAANLSS